MPTVITHAIVGAALAPLAGNEVPKRRLAFALALVAMLPDADVLSFAAGIPYPHPLGHRGLSHSLAFAAVVGLITPPLVQRDLRPASRAWRKVAGLAFLACASHGLLDACTDGGQGVGLLLPFSTARFFFPWRPIHVSPIGLFPFLSERGLRVLASEICWVWLPTLLVLLITRVLNCRPQSTPGAERHRSP